MPSKGYASAVQRLGEGYRTLHVGWHSWAGVVRGLRKAKVV